jgi:L-fucose isomerase-like protein
MKTAMVFMGRKRPGFDPEWGSKVEAEVREFCETSSDAFFFPEEKAVDDASMRRVLAACESAGCDVMTVLQTTAGDARLVPTLSSLWEGPLVLWATPENPEGRMISSCSLVGVHLFASVLRQSGRPFEIVYGAPEDARTQREFDQAVRVAYAVRRMNRSKVGLIGYNAPGYANMHADAPTLKRELGVLLHHVGLQELLDAMDGLGNDEVVADVQRVLDIGFAIGDVAERDLETQSRFYLAFKQLIDSESLDAIAVRCWPELPNVTGQWPYLAMTRLSNEGLPNGMEGDVDGAISCLLGEAMGFGRGYLSDWLEHTEDSITLWHGGNAPLDLSQPLGSEHGPRLVKHFNVRKPMVVESWLKVDMAVTLFRIWRCDGRYHMTARHARTVEPMRDLHGTNGLARIDGASVYTWFEDLCHAGMPHHVAVFAGNHVQVLRRFARQTGMVWVA